MNETQVLAKLTTILRDLLGDQSIELTMTTRRPEVAGWDSFAYVSFIVAVEMEFGISFGVAEVESFADVGAIVRRILTLLPGS
jgi:acyl carrier protein